MDLIELHKQKIVNDVFSCYDLNWSALISDVESFNILDGIFKKFDLLDYGITAIYSRALGHTAIYFLNAIKDNSKKINSESKDKLYSEVRDISNIQSIANILNGRLIISLLPCVKNFAEEINKICVYDDVNNLQNIYFLVFDRTIDLYTPLL